MAGFRQPDVSEGSLGSMEQVFSASDHVIDDQVTFLCIHVLDHTNVMQLKRGRGGVEGEGRGRGRLRGRGRKEEEEEEFINIS